MKIQLSPAQIAVIQKPVRGKGGFQVLLRRLQRQISSQGVLTATDQDVEKLLRYAFTYGQGGFEERIKGPARTTGH